MGAGGRKASRLSKKAVGKMPYTRDQLKLFGIALSMKRGKTPYSYSEEAARIAKSTSESKLESMIAEGEKKSKGRRIK